MEACTETVSIQKIHEVLKQFLSLYRDEVKAGDQLYRESQTCTIKTYTKRAKEADRLYWESAQDTVLDIAAALHIPLELQHVNS